nr:hypothetical protein [Tanacetum cinerariifolium]
MTTTAAQQVALNNALVPLEKQVKISKCNMRIDPAKTKKEPTYQVVLDALALTTSYPAFLITVDVLEIYMQQFWFTIKKKDSTLYMFKIDKKSYRIDMEEEEEPKPAKKVVSSKKPATERQSSVVQIRDTPGVSVSKKKAPTNAFRRSKIDTTIHQVGGSSEGANFQSEVPDEPKGKNEFWGDSGDEANEQSEDEYEQSDDDQEQDDDERTKSDDEEEETQDDEYIHTLDDYLPIDDETKNETDDVTKKEYKRINEELYGDVNVSLTYVKSADKEKDDEQMRVTGLLSLDDAMHESAEPGRCYA